MEQLATVVSKTDQVVFNDLNADVAVIWSVLWYGRMAPNHSVWQTFRSVGKNVLVCEVGGLVRNKTWRFSVNGINADALYPTINISPDRPKKLGLELKPWHDGDYYVVCGQHGMSEQWRTQPPMIQYYEDTISKIRSVDPTTRIILREHPRWRVNISKSWMDDNNVQLDIPKKIDNTYDDYDFSRLLENAKAVVSWSSNPGIEAVLAGTPVITGPNHLARPMGSNTFEDIINPPKPDRDRWFLNLCHKEFLEEEIQSGIFWPSLREKLKHHSI